MPTGLLGILLSLIVMALGFLVLYFIVKAAVKNGVLAALDDSRSTVGVHRLITQLRGGGQQVAQQQQQYAPQPPQQQVQQPQYAPQPQQQYPQQGPPQA